MNLKRRLERLREAQRDKSRRDSNSQDNHSQDTHSPENHSQGEVATGAAGADEAGVAERKEGGQADELADGTWRADSLEALREQLRMVIGKPESRSAPNQRLSQRSSLAKRSLADLPFVEVQTPWGSLLQNRIEVSAQQKIGGQILGAAVRAEPQFLAQLALDDGLAETRAEGWLFFDTETTGLAGAGTLAFLVGLAFLRKDGSVVVEQLLLREPEGEPALLARVSQCFAEASALVSFNGKSFDRPLLASRCIMNRQPELVLRPHLDLLHVGRRLHQSRVGKCNLGNLEKHVLDFDRGPDIAGSEIAPIYGQFLRSGDAAQVEQVVKHNYWDVLSMVALVGVYGNAHSQLVPQDLAGVARTLRRAGAIEAATYAAEIACRRGGGGDALRIRAQLAKARGDRIAATQDFEQLAGKSHDPAACLELAKLYEHAWKRPQLALDWVSRGTSEDPEENEHRRKRLHRKIQRLTVT